MLHSCIKHTYPKKLFAVYLKFKFLYFMRPAVLPLGEAPVGMGEGRKGGSEKAREKRRLEGKVCEGKECGFR